MKRILIIDNNIPTRLVLEQKLQNAGYEVVGRSEGQNGIDYYRNNPIDLIIADVLPPELEGLKTIIQIIQEFPNACIIAKTENNPGIGFKKYNPLQSAKLFGARRTFSSPMNLKELLAIIKELTSRQLKYLRRNKRYIKFNIKKGPVFDNSLLWNEL